MCWVCLWGIMHYDSVSRCAKRACGWGSWWVVHVSPGWLMCDVRFIRRMTTLPLLCTTHAM
jgi:hypothetical protein